MMLNRSLMSRLTSRKHLRVEWRSASSLQAQADAHRNRREWSDAASLYARALLVDPSRIDLLVQQGNCLKESGAYAEAYQAYQAVSRAGPSGEIELQLGHLLKVSGNLVGSQRAYERSVRLGNALAAEELATLPTILPQAIRNLAPRMETEAATGTGQTFGGTGRTLVQLLSWCEHDPTRTAPIHAAAHALQLHGFPELARSVFELAFLYDGFSAAAVQRQGHVATGTGLWDGMVAAAVRPGAEAVRTLPSGAERHLLDFAALAGLGAMSGGADDDPLVGLELTRGSDELPAGAVPATTQDSVQSANFVHRLFEALAADQNSPSLRDLLDELSMIDVGAPPLIAFGAAATDVPLQVGRVLGNGLRYYLRHHHHALRGPVGAPAMFLAAARHGVGGQGRAPSLCDGGSRTLGRVMAARGDARENGSLSGLVLLIGRMLPVERLAALVEDLLDRHLTHAAALLVDDAAIRDALSVEMSQSLGLVLGAGGLPRLALHLQRRLARLHRNQPDVLQELARQEKAAGEFARSAAALRQALAIRPDDRFARGELLDILPEFEELSSIAAEFSGHPETEALLHEQLRFRLHLQPWLWTDEGGDQVHLHELAPELAPESKLHPSVSYADQNRIEVRQVGWERRRGLQGEYSVLRGIEAIRATCFSIVPILRLRVRLDGRTIASLQAPGHPVDGAESDMRKYVFNAWIDASDLARGPHELQLYFEETTGGHRSHTQMIVVDRPREVDAAPLSDALVVPLAEPGAGSVEERVAAMPSMARPADRSFFGRVPERVLVVRADQLGDFVASIPAIRRLHELLPRAELVALVTPLNEGLARSLGVFADVVTVALTYDHATRRRHLTLARQTELRRTLTRIGFDLAIDLSPGAESRSLLRLSGAPHMVGFHPQHFPWLSFGIGTITRDPINGKERGSHALLILSLVEALGAALRHAWTTIPAAHAPYEALHRFGIGGGDPFVFIHAGARLRIKRWPIGHYLDLAGLIVARTDMKVVMLSDEAEDGHHAAASQINPDRFSFTTGRIAPEELEALIAHCRVFVGNDTGPKHLAALRGAKTVSLHMGQVNWDEWGQEGQGVILSRRAPCVGCGIENVEDCGKDLACLTGIRPDEVFKAVQEQGA